MMQHDKNAENHVDTTIDDGGGDFRFKSNKMIQTITITAINCYRYTIRWRKYAMEEKNK